MSREERAATVAYLKRLALKYRWMTKRVHRGMHVKKGDFYAIPFSLRAAADQLRSGK